MDNRIHAPATPPASADEVRIADDAPVSSREDSEALPGGRRSLDIRKKLTSAQKLTLVAIPFGLTVVSWFLGGNEVWSVGAGLAAIGVILFAVCGLRVVAYRDLCLGDFLVLGYLSICWGSWTAIGYYFPLTTVNVIVQFPTQKRGKVEIELPCPMRVVYGGHVILLMDQGHEWSFSVRGSFHKEQLKIEMFPSPRLAIVPGWVDVPYEVSGSEIWVSSPFLK